MNARSDLLDGFGASGAWERPDALRPTQDGPCVLLTHTMPGVRWYNCTHVVYVALTRETRDPLWWHARMPGRDVELALLPKGYDCTGFMRHRQIIARWRAGETPAPLPDPEMAPEVVIATRDGATLATLTVRKHEGMPIYEAAPTGWEKLLQRADARRGRG